MKLHQVLVTTRHLISPLSDKSSTMGWCLVLTNVLAHTFNFLFFECVFSRQVRINIVSLSTVMPVIPVNKAVCSSENQVL